MLRAVKNIHRFGQHALIGKYLVEILEMYDSLVAHQGKSGDDTEVSLTAVRAGDRKITVRKDLLTALMVLTGNEKRKRCAGPCREVKALSAFSVDNMREDGHNRFCLLCERKRVKEYTAKKKREGLK